MKAGVLFAASAYLLWGLLPLYLKSLDGVTPVEILLCRMIWALVFLAMVLAVRKQWGWLKTSLRQPRLVAMFTLSAAFLAVNWFTYIWAVNHNHVIDASLGYFINPLISIVLGVLFLKERLRSGQWLAIAIAACGVLWLTVQAGRPPWIALTLACTFGTYGLLRKTAALGALEGLAMETLVLFPFAVAWLGYLAWHGQSSMVSADTSTQLLLVLAGPLTAIPLLLFAAGARKITLSLLGILQYIGPSVQLVLGILLWHESFSSMKAVGFALIWVALVFYTGEGFYVKYKRNKC